MCSVKSVFNEIMRSGYDAHKEALDVILVSDSDDAICNHSVRFIQGFTRVTCVIAIITCAIHVLQDNPALVNQSQSAVPILTSCVNLLCNFRAVGPVDECFEMLRLPGLFPKVYAAVCCVSCGCLLCDHMSVCPMLKLNKLNLLTRFKMLAETSESIIGHHCCHRVRNKALGGRAPETERHRVCGLIYESGNGHITTNYKNQHLSWLTVHCHTCWYARIIIHPLFP